MQENRRRAAGTQGSAFRAQIAQAPVRDAPRRIEIQNEYAEDETTQIIEGAMQDGVFVHNGQGTAHAGNDLTTPWATLSGPIL